MIKGSTSQYDLTKYAWDWDEDASGKPAADFTGETFGTLNVVGKESRGNRILWEVLCDCGNRRFVRKNRLNDSLSCKSCNLQTAEEVYNFTAPPKLISAIVSLISQAPFSVEELRISTRSNVEVIMDCLSVLVDEGRISMTYAPNQERLYALKKASSQNSTPKVNRLQTNNPTGLREWSQNFRGASVPTIKRRDN